MSFYVYETLAKPKAPRTCTACGQGMGEGYLHEESGSTYCKITCLDTAFTKKEQEAMYIHELFWRDWHDEVEGLA